jgi:hypothetical protein
VEQVANMEQEAQVEVEAHMEQAAHVEQEAPEEDDGGYDNCEEEGAGLGGGQQQLNNRLVEF